MPSNHLSMGLCFSVLFWAALGRATVDGGVTSSLLGTAKDGRLAIILESSVQETCHYESCVIYVVDTTARTFKRRLLKKLESRFDDLKKDMCRGKDRTTCSQLVSGRLIEEEQSSEGPEAVALARYFKTLTFWQRALLGKVSPPPKPEPLKVEEGLVASKSPFVLAEFTAPRNASGAVPLELRLRERWTAPSFRTTTESDAYCDPSKISTCKTEERWEDGMRTQAWACSVPKSAKEGPDCAGRASFVRVEARWGQGPYVEGRSSWVEPGRLAQAAMGLIKDRKVDLFSLEMARHSMVVHRLSHGLVITGGFAHGMFANGSWFPLVVAVPFDVPAAPTDQPKRDKGPPK